MRNKLFINVIIPALLILGISSAVNIQQGEVPSSTADKLFVHFIDVGQADSILAKLPDNRVMLIDAGTNSAGDDVIDYLKKQNISKIDLLIATHPHEDHIGGMDDVIKELDIGEIYMPKATTTTKTFQKLLMAIKDKNLKVNSAAGGIVLTDENGLKIEFLAPNSDSYDELNDYSAVTKITYKDTSFLFTGDAEEASENEMISKGYNLDCDVLKVGHHGSSTSSSEAFLQAVSPKIAVISVGKNNEYRHPTAKTLQNLKKYGADIYRTDEMGTIVMESDGTDIKISN